jgi:hypothetical protein
MAVNYIMSLKTTRMQAVVTALDAGAGNASLEICTAGFAAVLAALSLSKPSFTVAADTITMAGAPKSAVAGATGNAAVARLKAGDGTTVVVNNLTVGTQASDINLINTSITSGQMVTVQSGTIQHTP